MKLIPSDTIAAIATAIVPQQGSVGIVRLSGKNAVAIAEKIFFAPGQQKWESHRILYGYIQDDQTKKTVDEALLLIMRSPRSYTREDVIEFHCHGGIMAVQQVLQLCLENGARLAQPGEFTLRAFLNGRIDLTQAESISDLVGAKSAQAAQFALSGIQGKLALPIKKLRSTCLDILAEIEARIDFEDDLPPLNQSLIIAQINEICQQTAEILSTSNQGELIRTGLKVAIVGQPNVGKSSLLNAWSKSDRAIVTDLPGTTRDVVESQLVVGGIPIQVLDTAGIRTTDDTVEKIGVERSRMAAKSADLVLLTIDGQQGWTESDEEIYAQVKDKNIILVINKIDLVNDINNLSMPINFKYQVHTAAANNQGINHLENAILTAINAEKMQAQNMEFAINQRQASALTKAQISLEQVKTTISEKLPLDFWTIDLRAAIQALGEITGEEVTESVLDRIFSRFCIGK
jgi:tRNA modification GTPase